MFEHLHWTDAIGLTAACLSAITFLPQVLQAWKTKSVKDLNLMMLILVFTSVVLWLTYGIVKHDVSLILANTIVVVLSGMLLWFKFTFKE